MIGNYPDLTEIELADRPLLDPMFRALGDGVSELTFAGIYCFRGLHNYRITRLADDTIVLAGSDKGKCFFICPFALPEKELLDELFARCVCMKLATTGQAERLRAAGYRVTEDRDNFDYLYRREQLAFLAGRALQKKRNLVHHFQRENVARTEPLSPERIPDALAILEAWRERTRDQADYAPARDALLHAQEFGLQGRITYVGDRPVGYAQGEPAGAGGMYIVHFEKTVPDRKGLYQFINQDFVRALPPEFTLVNREQDLGDPGLRQAKLTYRPCGYVHKFRAYRAYAIY
ncbi:MAG: DUF2156 domain-containing protein [Deltaproteobacteria bacterium]|nr:DUF2156 domain-containing protein [Deltaproteobacteria bacterium]